MPLAVLPAAARLGRAGGGRGDSSKLPPPQHALLEGNPCYRARRAAAAAAAAAIWREVKTGEVTRLVTRQVTLEMLQHQLMRMLQEGPLQQTPATKRKRLAPEEKAKLAEEMPATAAESKLRR